MNIKTFKVVYNVLVGLLVLYALISYFFKNSFDPETLKVFILTGAIVLTCAIVVRIIIYFRR
ncbi:MAG: hypothetical protein PHI48_13360 [Bacteroidales bacterium]|nr:hypothetical protein [Bacteroidales bacterium]MDD4823530.1 hypothetical protein [Bacteroidales bacterium]